MVLVEVYDAGGGTAQRLVNVSARNFVGTGDNLMIAGFVVDGPVAKTLLIRAVGPTLAGFGVGGTLADPKLEIFRNGRLVAVMPVGRARPGLRGRGEWRVLDAIAHPRLGTVQEERVVPVEKTSPFYINPNPTPAAVRPVLSREQYLPSGPNNPTGVVWINLAKGAETTPQPFGLHGSSIPSGIQTVEGIGGFRLTNWDALRAATLLPPGTKLEWKP